MIREMGMPTMKISISIASAAGHRCLGREPIFDNGITSKFIIAQTKMP
jgi:hypothetical protein